MLSCSAVARASVPCAAVTAASAELEVPQELVLGERTLVQRPWELRVTASPSYVCQEGDFYGWALSLELGIVDRLQLGIDVPTGHQRSADGTATGIGNIEAGVLYSLMEAANRGGLSAGVEVAFPTLVQELGQPAFAVEPLVIGELASGGWRFRAPKS